MKKAPRTPEEFIVPLNINGLDGRMLNLPAKGKSKRNILFIYGSHSSIERWWGIAQVLNEYGNVIMPDLPGLGGMTPLYKIGRQPTIDNMADYLAAFIKLRYHNKKMTIFAMSLGFVIATRMLQKYPELVKKVDLLVSVVGFAHHEDFIWTKNRHRSYFILSKIFSRRWTSFLYRHTALQPSVLRQIYHKTYNAKKKFMEVSGDEFDRTMDMELELWRINDIRTQFKHYVEMLSLDNTHKAINLPIHHIAAKDDRYFNNVRVEEHMRRIFTDFTIYYMKSSNHAPSVIPDVKSAQPFVPAGIRLLLKKKTG